MSITPRILLVDDIKTNLKIYKYSLTGENYKFFAYSDSEEALKNIEIIQPHLLILDIEMPKLDGIQLLEKIRKQMGTSNVPAIFITTLSDEKRLKQAWEVGVNDILPKEFKPYQLKFKVKSLLSQYFLQQKLMVLVRQMKDKSNENKDLVKVLCHDLLNPLSALLLLSKRDKNERFHGIAQSAIDIIEHVREILALEDGKKDLHIESVHLNEALEEALEIMKPKFEEKSITYKLDEGFDNDVFITAERTSLIHQVINNIVSNAVKFTESGGHIDFILRLRNNQVFFAIRDKGIGIPKKMMPILFSKFEKTSRLGTNKEKGTGFGMPLAKTYMEFYGGTIEVDSIEKTDESTEHGTIFTLIFSLVELKAKDLKEEAS